MKIHLLRNAALIIPLLTILACGNKTGTTETAASQPTPVPASKTSTPPGVTSISADCGLKGSIEQRLQDCAKNSKIVKPVQEGWSLVAKSGNETTWLNPTTQMLFWLPAEGGSKTYDDARNFCLTKDLAPVVMRIPGKDEWTDLLKANIKAVHPSLTGTYWTSTIDDAKGTVEKPIFSENSLFDLKTFVIKDGSFASLAAAQGTAPFACIGRMDNSLKITFREPVTHNFTHKKCSEDPSLENEEDLAAESPFKQYGITVCGNLNPAYSTFKAVTGCTCKRSLFGSKNCVLYIDYSASLKCLK